MKNSRDNFKATIIKFFLLALVLFFALVGMTKQIFYGKGAPVRSGLPSVAGGLNDKVNR